MFVLKKFRTAFVQTGTLYRNYWKSYGGAGAVISSPYFVFALFVSVACAGLWTGENWWDLPVSVLPNLIGFTLAGYAILLAFGDRRFLQILANAQEAGDDGSRSGFMQVSATFMHFLLVQILALLLAIFAKSRPTSTWLWWVFDHSSHGNILKIIRFSIAYCGWAIGFAFFIYAICLAMAAVAAIFRIARWYQTSMKDPPP